MLKSQLPAGVSQISLKWKSSRASVRNFLKLRVELSKHFVELFNLTYIGVGSVSVRSQTASIVAGLTY